MTKRVLRGFRGATDSSGLRIAQYLGRDHLVVPVVALIGDAVVHPMNATGPEYVPAHALASAPGSWNGRPVFPDHPTDEGEAVSGNSPRTIEAMAFGQMFDTRFEDGALRTNVYLDPTATVHGAASVINRIRSGEQVEVSVGAWVTARQHRGISPSGVPYEFVWESIVPDHLAMLPEGVEGACSNAMGCGVAQYSDPTMSANTRSTTEDTNVTREQLWAALRDFFSGDQHSCACQSTDKCTCEADDTTTPEVATLKAAQTGDDTSADAADVPSIVVEPTAPGDTTMSISDLVGRLIANSRFTEDHRNMLETLSEDDVQELIDGTAAGAEYELADEGGEVVIYEYIDEPEEVILSASGTVTTPDGTFTSDDIRELRAMADAYKAEQAKAKAAVVADLVKCQKSFAQADLEAMDIDSLTKLQSALGARNYDLQNAGHTAPKQTKGSYDQAMANRGVN